MRVQTAIREKLEAALAPHVLEITDDSHRHAGHAGARPEGETHFAVLIVSDRFQGKSRVERQRLVYGILRDELAGPIHALSLTTKAPGEL